MNVDPQLAGILSSHEVQYALAIGAVAALVLLLLRRQPAPASLALFIGGALLALAASPLLEGGLTLLDRLIGTASTELFPTGEFWRTLLIGGAGAAAGVWCMARAWQASPER